MVKSPGKNGASLVSAKLYASTYGVKFKRGFFYRGLNHQQWSACYFLPKWKIWCWYDPCTYDWYYWCGDKSCFLPVLVIVEYPPIIGVVEGTMPLGSEDVPQIKSGETDESKGKGVELPNVPNPEGIE